MLTDAELAKLTPYLTVIPGRHPSTKIHQTLGHARGAISTANYGRNGAGKQVYAYGPTGWELLHDILAGTTTDNMPWKKD